MKRPTLTLAVAGILAIMSLGSHHAYADWDAASEARENAKRKAELQQQAQRKAEADKMRREASAKVYREGLGKDAVGKSDAEVERLYKQRQSDAIRQANAVEASMKSAGRTSKTGSQADAMAQSDAAMRAMYGKSTGDIANMSEKEREAFVREMERKHTK